MPITPQSIVAQKQQLRQQMIQLKQQGFDEDSPEFQLLEQELEEADLAIEQLLDEKQKDMEAEAVEVMDFDEAFEAFDAKMFGDVPEQQYIDLYMDENEMWSQYMAEENTGYAKSVTLGRFSGDVVKGYDIRVDEVFDFLKTINEIEEGQTVDDFKNRELIEKRA